MSTVNELVLQMATYRDKFGLITQANMDAGDCLNRTAHYYGALAALNQPEDDEGNISHFGYIYNLNKITKGLPDGRYRRHPDTTKWYSNPDNVTRDQMAPAEAAMVLCQFGPEMRSNIKARLCRFLFHFSTQDQIEGSTAIKHKLPDPPSPIELGVIVRGLRLSWLYWTLPLLDYFMLREARKQAEGSADVNEGQLLLYIATALRYQPTTRSLQASHIMYRNKALIERGLRYYYREGVWSNGIEPLGELMIEVLHTFDESIDS